MNLVLASGSPRRKELLDSLGLTFDVHAPEVDETRHQGESPGTYVERVARLKAAVPVVPDGVVLAADTTVVLDGRILGKPGHPEEARSMLRRLSGTTHEVFTGVAVRRQDECFSVVATTEVTMIEMTSEEIASYVESGEPMDKAGAYALQGSGGIFVAKIVGSPSNVIGLPIHLIPRLLSRVGAELSTFRSR